MYIGSTIGAISYTSGAFAFALLVPLCVLLQHQKNYPPVLVAACVITIIRCLSALLYSHYDIAGSLLLLVDFVYYGVWLYTLFSTAQHTTQQPLPMLLQKMIAFIYGATAVFALVSFSFYSADLQIYATETAVWCNIILPIASLILIEHF